MDVNSGQILAMANLGSYDPNNYQEIYDQALAGQLEAQYQDALLLDKDSNAYQEAMSAYNQAVAAERLRQWRNRCVSDGYEPGSTFKLVTLAAAWTAARSRKTARSTAAVMKPSTTASRRFPAGRRQVTACRRPWRRWGTRATLPSVTSAST